MKIPLIDLKAQYHSIKPEVDAAIERVLESGKFILGPEVEIFEKEMAEYLGVKHGIGVASGTDALKIALLSAGVKKQDEVITTPFTFIATAEAVVDIGAKPVFVDIDPETFNINPSLIEDRISGKTKAILPVHLFGNPAEMDAIMQIAGKHELKVVEDCAQALGSEYKGRKAGSMGDAGCLSFFPGKNLGCYGDGGMVVTDDEALADKARMFRNHGAKRKYFHALHGFNSRLDPLQAAVLRVKLRYLDDWNRKRGKNALIYRRGLDHGVKHQKMTDGAVSSFNYYSILVENRDAVAVQLKNKGVSSMIYYPLCLHLQEVYRGFGHKKGDFPAAEWVQEKILSLPMFAELKYEQIEGIAKALLS